MGNARNLADNLPLEGHLAGRNVIINGAMNFSQRQGSSSNVGNQYVLDRFAVYKQNTGSTYTCSQNSVTDLAGFSNSLKMDCTTADTSIASNEEVKIVYKMEGQDLQRFKKGHATALGFTLSFYAKTNKTGVYCVELYDRDNGRDVSGSYTVADTNWNRYTISFPADTTGKFDDNNGSSLELSFWLVAGSAVQGGTLNTTWRSATDPSSATGQVNFADNTSNDWEITGVQLEVGSSATHFEHEPISVTLAKCQRYYYVLDGNKTSWMYPINTNNASGYRRVSIHYPTSMRTTPTATASIVHSGGTSGVDGGVWISLDCVGIYVNSINSESDYAYVNALTADAEL
jgi:hypothetical protein